MVRMRTAGLLVWSLFGLTAVAQTTSDKDPGILRGFLGALQTDRFMVHSNGNIFPFRRDCLTWVERDNQRIAFSDLHPGEHIEVVCDRTDAVPHYARVIHVISAAKRNEILRYTLESYRLRKEPVGFLPPRGELTFSGVVGQLQDGEMVLHTRQQGAKTIYLRPDTRYLEDGSLVGWRELTPHTHVFVHAGRNLDNEIEAYQIIWGRILNPQASEPQE